MHMQQSNGAMMFDSGAALIKVQLFWLCDESTVSDENAVNLCIDSIMLLLLYILILRSCWKSGMGGIFFPFFYLCCSHLGPNINSSFETVGGTPTCSECECVDQANANALFVLYCLVRKWLYLSLLPTSHSWSSLDGNVTTVRRQARKWRFLDLDWNLRSSMNEKSPKLR